MFAKTPVKLNGEAVSVIEDNDELKVNTMLWLLFVIDSLEFVIMLSLVVVIELSVLEVEDEELLAEVWGEELLWTAELEVDTTELCDELVELALDFDGFRAT